MTFLYLEFVDVTSVLIDCVILTTCLMAKAVFCVIPIEMVWIQYLVFTYPWVYVRINFYKTLGSV